MESFRTIKNSYAHAICICALIAIFLLDLFTPSDIICWEGYLLIPVLLFRRCGRHILYTYGAACTLLMAMGLSFSQLAGYSESVLNRCLGILVFWLAVALLARYRKAEDRLRKNEERYRHRYNDTPVMLYSIDECGRLISVSNFWLKHLGYEREEVLGRPATDFFTPESGKAAADVDIPILFATGGFHNKPFRMMKRNGEIIDVLISATVEWDDEGNTARARAAITDITELKQMEDARSASEAKYRQLHESLRDGYVLVGMNGAILECNETYREMLGYGPEEMDRLTYFDITPLRWHEMENEIVRKQILPNGYSDVYEKEYIRKDGTIFPVELRTCLLRDDQGAPLGMWALARDITDRKTVEMTSRRIEESYRDLADSIADLFVALDEDLCFTYWNRASTALSGIAASSAMGKSIRELAPGGADIENLESRLLDVLATREPTVFVQSFVHQGGMVFFEISAYPSQSGLVVFGRDISVRTRMEEELRRTHDELEQRVRERTEELEKSRIELEMRNQALLLTSHELELSLDRYANLYDLAPLSYITLDSSGIIQEINLTGAVMLGYERETLLGQPFSGYVRKENVRLFHGHLRRCRKNIGHVTTELYIKLAEGALLPVLLHSVPVDDSAGEGMLYRTAVTDISERKLAEEKMLRLNRLYVVLSETDNAVVRASDRDDLFREICRIAVVHGGFALAWIGLIDETAGAVRPVASTGEGGADLLLPSVEAASEGSGVVWTAIRKESYCISNDFLADPWLEAAAQSGIIRAAAAVALKLNGNVIGALCLYAVDENFFDPQFEALLQQIGADISYAIDSLARAARQLEAEQALQKETLERLLAVEELRKKERLLILQSRQAAMGEMIGNIAHQWRQPLNTLGLIVQEMPVMLSMGQFDQVYLDAKVKKAMQLILHMSQTIDDFRMFFRLDNEKVLFDVNEVIEKTISLVDVSFRQRGIKIEVCATENVHIAGYPNEFSQVIMNLLTNARDALLERQVAEPRIVVNLMMSGGKAVCTVTDNAGGISEDIIGRVFEPYFTTKAVDKGTGIGLYMAKTIVDTNMNGALTVSNAPGGAEFRIEV